MRITGTLIIMLVALLAAAAVAMAQPVSACAPPPSAPYDLDIARYYSDGAKSEVDKARFARNQAQTRDLKRFVGQVAKLADRAWRKRKQEDRKRQASCALNWLAAWAQGRAYLGAMSTKQAQSQRKWDLAGLGLAYFKVRPWASLEQRSAIEPWLSEIAERVYAHAAAPGRTRNNHWYWTGLAMMASSLATGKEGLWQRAQAIYDDALADIARDGTLPLELSRGKRALHYHAFSVMPLVAMAEIATRRGDDWFVRDAGALKRLVAVTVAGLVDPVVFDRLAAVRQERPVNSRAGWAFLYALRHPRRGIPPNLSAKRAHRLLGGDVRVLIAALEAQATRTR